MKRIVNQMFNFTPPSGQNVVNSGSLIPPHTGRQVLRVLVALFLGCLVVFLGYRRGSSPKPVVLDRALFYNADSLSYYLERAYLSDDPKALFVTGMASRLRYLDPEFPKDLPTVNPEPEGAYMLVLAAELGSEDAMTYIRCEHAHGTWDHVLPKNFK